VKTGADVDRTAMSEDYETKETERTTSVNRRRFVKALGMTGGAAVSGSVFSSPAKAAPSGQSSSVSKCSITGDELNNFIHNIMKHDDIINIIDMTFREVVQEGTITGVSHNGPTDVAIIGMFESHYRIDRSTSCGRPGERFRTSLYNLRSIA